MKLTKAQEEMLKKHAVSHSKKHITDMRRLMEKGHSFKVAHDMAMKKK